jgi:hypothetical protein
MTSSSHTPCFKKNADLFFNRRISTEKFFDNMLAHFTGVWHPEDNSIASIPPLGGLGVISEAVRDCAQKIHNSPNSQDFKGGALKFQVMVLFIF